MEKVPGSSSRNSRLGVSFPKAVERLGKVMDSFTEKNIIGFYLCVAENLQNEGHYVVVAALATSKVNIHRHRLTPFVFTQAYIVNDEGQMRDDANILFPAKTNMSKWFYGNKP